MVVHPAGLFVSLTFRTECCQKIWPPALILVSGQQLKILDDRPSSQALVNLTFRTNLYPKIWPPTQCQQL